MNEVCGTHQMVVKMCSGRAKRALERCRVLLAVIPRALKSSTGNIILVIYFNDYQLFAFIPLNSAEVSTTGSR